MLEGSLEGLVAYASRTLTDVEKWYSQLDKEALAIVFGVKRFHHYLYGLCSISSVSQEQFLSWCQVHYNSSHISWALTSTQYSIDQVRS